MAEGVQLFLAFGTAGLSMEEWDFFSRPLSTNGGPLQNKQTLASFLERAQMKKFIERDLSNPNKAILSRT